MIGKVKSFMESKRDENGRFWWDDDAMSSQYLRSLYYEWVCSLSRVQQPKTDLDPIVVVK